MAERSTLHCDSRKSVGRSPTGGEDGAFESKLWEDMIKSLEGHQTQDIHKTDLSPVDDGFVQVSVLLASPPPQLPPPTMLWQNMSGHLKTNIMSTTARNAVGKRYDSSRTTEHLAILLFFTQGSVMIGE